MKSYKKTLFSLFLVLIIPATSCDCDKEDPTQIIGSHLETVRRIGDISYCIYKYYQLYNRYPESEEFHKSITKIDYFKMHHCYMIKNDEIVDVWVNPFRYRMPGEHWTDAYDLWSAGPNGIDENGEGDDVTSWHLFRKNRGPDGSVFSIFFLENFPDRYEKKQIKKPDITPTGE